MNPFLRREILERDSEKCMECNEYGSLVHHVIPKVLGGADHPDNLITVCKKCHMKIERETISGRDLRWAETRMCNEIRNDEEIIGLVKPSGTGGHIILPISWLGTEVVVTRVEM